MTWLLAVPAFLPMFAQAMTCGSGQLLKEGDVKYVVEPTRGIDVGGGTFKYFTIAAEVGLTGTDETAFANGLCLSCGWGNSATAISYLTSFSDTKTFFAVLDKNLNMIRLGRLGTTAMAVDSLTCLTTLNE